MPAAPELAVGRRLSFAEWHRLVELRPNAGERANKPPRNKAEHAPAFLMPFSRHITRMEDKPRETDFISVARIPGSLRARFLMC
jgi:hypothetical protein